MDTPYYLEQFQKAAAGLDHHALQQKQLDVETGVWLQSVALKLHKPTWSDKASNAAIFFSIWVNEQAEKGHRLLYNIHALKLREWKGYSITSRAFAADFREAFKPYDRHWPNVSVEFGPQTLMQGWIPTGGGLLQEPIHHLADKFLEIDHLIDNLLIYWLTRTPT
ncbi:hypothetical protein [Puia dinghuensis]|uniref:Uncharacterized protein n=1 Tax=Puia dinghuensis TaxID=1792502 RepID=A0A8J2U936_9BACT|nr:hypothetical protein [Puia dinghuensis]GGA86665.1 hypothetical protein GCM10011511_07160 [Puia dinghuensis]